MRTVIALCLAVWVVLPAMGQADEPNETQVKEWALEAILENPDIVLEALRLLEQRERDQQAAAALTVLAENRDLLFFDPNAPVLGNPDGDVTVVEFFDYNCPYCRRAKPHIEALLEADPSVRLVYREWPILGQGSVFAARAALAARNQGKYTEFHWALMGMSGRAEEPSVMRIAEQIGLDVDQLRLDMNAPEIESHIALSNSLSRALGFSGTPSFVIGDALVPGVIEADRMIALVESARSGKQSGE